MRFVIDDKQQKAIWDLVSAVHLARRATECHFTFRDALAENVTINGGFLQSIEPDPLPVSEIEAQLTADQKLSQLGNLLRSKDAYEMDLRVALRRMVDAMDEITMEEDGERTWKYSSTNQNVADIVNPPLERAKKLLGIWES